MTDAGIQTEPDPRERLRRWLSSGVPPESLGPDDEASLVATAALQGLAPLLSSAVRELPAWSAPARTRLRATERAALVHGVRQLDLVCRLQTRLLKRGLRLLPLKGAAVVERFYDSIAHRSMGDVDLLALDGWRDTCTVVIEAGLDVVGQADHATVFRDRDWGETVELHHALTSCPGFYRLDTDGWWARSVPGLGQVPLLPSAEDTLVHLAAHAAFQHALVLTLGQYLDFVRIVSTGLLDMDLLLAVAARTGAMSALASALTAVEVVFGFRPAAGAHEIPTAGLPRGLRRHLRRCSRRPLSLVSPSRSSLSTLRWWLAAGRRGSLIKLTLLPREPGERLTFRAAVRRAMKRLAGIAWRRCAPRMTRFRRSFRDFQRGKR